MSGLNNWISQQQEEYQRKLSAWNLSIPVINYNQDRVRKDAYGSFIVWSEYGKQTQFGWEIDHELPKSQFPSVANQPANLRALHWKNNRVKSDKLDPNTLRKILGGF